MPLLALLEPFLPTKSVTAISLAVVALNATSGALAYFRQRRIDFHAGIPFALATLPGSIAGVLLVRVVARREFDLIFAALLVALAVFVVVAHEDRADRRPGGRRLAMSFGTSRMRAGRVPIPRQHPAWRGGLAGGRLRLGFLGSAGRHSRAGARGSAALPGTYATATSHFVLAIMATVGTATHIASGDLDGFTMARPCYWALVRLWSTGRRAAVDSRPGIAIVRASAIALAFVGLRLGAQALFG